MIFLRAGGDQYLQQVESKVVAASKQLARWSHQTAFYHHRFSLRIFFQERTIAVSYTLFLEKCGFYYTVSRLL